MGGLFVLHEQCTGFRRTLLFKLGLFNKKEDLNKESIPKMACLSKNFTYNRDVLIKQRVFPKSV